MAKAVTTGAEPAQPADLGWLLSSVLRAYLREAGAVVAEVPGGPRGYQVLATAAAGSCRNQAGIAEHLGLDRTVMTYLLDDLERAKLIQRQPDPADRRARQIVLTTQGRRRWGALTARLAEVERDVLGELSADEGRHLRELLGRAANGASGDQVAGSCDLPQSCG